MNTYLRLTENWIYPQIFKVPGVEGRVWCHSIANTEAFPPGHSGLIMDSPPRTWAMGVPGRVDALARRLGLPSLAEIRIRQWRPLILHAHFGPRGWESLPLRKRLDIPFITSFYGYDAWLLPQTAPIWHQRYSTLSTLCDLFLVEGPAMRRRLLALKFPPDKVVVQRIGVDLASLPFQAKDVSQGIRLVMVGRFVEKKGLSDGLRACALARSQGANLDITIIGDAIPDDPSGLRIKAELCALANGPDLSGAVRFTGFLSMTETRSLLTSQHVLLCPSKHSVDGDAEGGSPVVLTEAMALGLLCVGTSHCDIPEIIIDGRTGFLRAEGDVTGLAAVLCSLGSDQRKVEALTLAGRKHVEENFSLSTQLAKMRTVYQSLS